MAPYVRPYISPKQRAENRARWIRFSYWVAVAIPATLASYWVAVAIPATLAVMMFGYSDQAPAWLRAFTVNLDALFGFPVLWLIKAVAA